MSKNDAELFFKLHRSLMHFVNQRLRVVPDFAGPEGFAALPPEQGLELRNALLGKLDLIGSFVDENPAHLNDEEIDIVLSWRHQVAGTFYVFRQLKNCMIFLSSGETPVAYGVAALSAPFENMIGPYLPVMAEAALMPFKDKIVYDGLLSSYNISFGGGIKRSLNASYRRAKERLGIVTSLPIASIPTPAAKATEPKKQKPKMAASASKGVEPVLETIIGMTDEFCHEHLNDEYAELCRKLAGKLSRKRPSPLLRGMPKTWASGIVRTVGWVNFLDDRTTQPYMKLTAIDKAFGVAESSGQGKSAEIRKLLKIDRFDIHWTLPSRMDDNPLVWMLQVNGFMMDVRHAPREVQKLAFQKGIIPYIPADREAD